MKQPEDIKTLELDLASKRGRGRPHKVDALTPAERAKRYRDAKRASIKPAIKRDEKTVTENETTVLVSPAEYMRLKRMYWSLEGKVDLANKERDAAFKANAELTRRIEDLERDLHNSDAVGRINSDWATEKADRCITLEKELAAERASRK